MFNPIGESTLVFYPILCTSCHHTVIVVSHTHIIHLHAHVVLFLLVNNKGGIGEGTR